MLPAIKLQLGNYLVVCSLTLKKYICLKKHEQRALSMNLILKCGLEIYPTLPFRWAQVKKGPPPIQFFLSWFWCPISKKVDF